MSVCLSTLQVICQRSLQRSPRRVSRRALALPNALQIATHLLRGHHPSFLHALNDLVHSYNSSCTKRHGMQSCYDSDAFWSRAIEFWLLHLEQDSAS